MLSAKCWGRKLEALLDGYTAGSPWLVVSDGFPSGYLPRPNRCSSITGKQRGRSEKRKEAKGKRWIPHSQIAQPLRQLLSSAVSDEEVYGKQSRPIQAAAFHNTLNRLTGTTGTGEFAPYTQSQIFYQRDQRMDLWCVLMKIAYRVKHCTSCLNILAVLAMAVMPASAWENLLWSR